MTAPARRRRVSSETRALMAGWHERAQRATLLSLPSAEPREHLYDLLPQYPLRAGKGLRPILCLAACEAFGGTERDALPFAVAIELLHNAFLVHDDIQDGSRSRRGRAALHVEHGTPLALNAGNALAARANAVFLRAVRSPRRAGARALVDGWERMIDETIEGQALDLGWQRDGAVDVSIPDYLRMCAKKTAWYTTIQPLAMGAIVGSGRAVAARRTFPFGWLLGLLFQIANDLDGLQAAGGENDLEDGKRTIAAIHLLGTLTGAARVELVRVLALPPPQRRPEETAWLLDQLQHAGTIDYVRSCLLDLADAAQASAEDALGGLPPSPAREALLCITSVVLERPGSHGA